MRRFLLLLLIVVFVVTVLATLLSGVTYMSFPEAFAILFGLTLLGVLNGMLMRYFQVKK